MSSFVTWSFLFLFDLFWERENLDFKFIFSEESVFWVVATRFLTGPSFSICQWIIFVHFIVCHVKTGKSFDDLEK